MSDEKIYTNSQVEQLKYEIHDDFAVLKSKIKPIKFITETLKVRDVRYASSVNLWKIKLAFHIEGHSNEFAEDAYAYPVIYNLNLGTIDGEKTNGFYVFVPMRPQGIVELTDDDTLRVDYMVYDNW